MKSLPTIRFHIIFTLDGVFVTEQKAREYFNKPGSADWSAAAYNEMSRRILKPANGRISKIKLDQKDNLRE